MKLKIKTALGIDISDGRINLVLLKGNNSGVVLLKTASGAVPDGAIKNGNVEDAIALAKSIKELKAKNKIYARHAVFSPVIDPILTQVLDLPNNASGNIGQFVQNEVKHYAVFSMKKVAMDFCGIKSSTKAGNRCVFVVATDSQKIAESAEALNGAGLNIDAIEPASVAYIRACYAKKIAGKFDQNLLFAIVHNDVLTLCLFKNQILDFVKTERLDINTLHPDKCFDWITGKIDEVMKFYEHKVRDKCNRWNINIVADIRDKSIKKKIELWATRLHEAELSFRLLEDAYLDTSIAETELTDKPSAIAVGLAMKLLNFPNSGLNINLLPPETSEVKSEGKRTLVIANIAAVVFLLMILSTGFLGLQTKKINNNIKQKQQSQSGCSMNELVSLNKQITDISENLSGMSAILSAKSFLRWDQILNEICSTIPKPVQITDISSEDTSKVLFKGQALSYESIHFFVEMLNNSTYIKSASLIGTERDDEESGLVTYSVNCSLIK